MCGCVRRGEGGNSMHLAVLYYGFLSPWCLGPRAVPGGGVHSGALSPPPMRTRTHTHTRTHTPQGVGESGGAQEGGEGGRGGLSAT